MESTPYKISIELYRRQRRAILKAIIRARMTNGWPEDFQRELAALRKSPRR